MLTGFAVLHFAVGRDLLVIQGTTRGMMVPVFEGGLC